jgi:hypothetical protein
MNRHRTICMGIAVLATAGFASSDATSSAAPGTSPLPATTSVVAAPAPAPTPGQPCLAEALCALKQKMSAHHGTWSPALCRTIAEGVEASAARHDLSPALLLAVMIQESDLDETAARVSHPGGGIARDSGLMGIRCRLDQRGRCTNGLVRGMPWRQVMAPVTNIELGARYLALYRDGAGRSRIVVRAPQPDGTVRETVRNVPCRHLDHAYWAHYNHGTHYISRGLPRLYPLHVAALYAALGQTLGLDTSELARVKHTPAARSALVAVASLGDRAAGRRSSQLCAAVHAARPFCAAPAIAYLSPAAR